MKKTILLSCFSFLLVTQLATAQTGELWGMTPVGGINNVGVIFKIDVGGANFDTVYSLTVAGGDLPQGDLLNTTDSTLYGTNFYGGLNLDGTIFSYDPSKNLYTDLHDCDSATGLQPEGSLIQVNNGNIYGMTGSGGAHNFGVIFRFNPDSDTYADVHDFDSSHGGNPYGSLSLSANGKFYGMTQYGGDQDDGVIFSFDTLNNYMDLHDFDGTNGQWPYGSLVQSGNKLYGLTAYGGANSTGVVFSYDLDNNVFTKLYDFSSDSGGVPEGNLVQIPGSSIFYGTASEEGANNDGVIFSFDTLSNTYTDVFDFAGANGQTPPASLVLASDNKLYGMTLYGGANSDGTIFSFDFSDSDCMGIHDFNGIAGGSPNGSLIEINGTSGIKQLAANNNQLLIYPNPVSNQLTIINKQSSISTIRVTNIMGQVVYAFTLPKEQYSTQINVSALPSGLYFVSVTSNNQIITSKISVINR